jgi:GTPase involved in cell partitioning and DNA repair
MIPETIEKSLTTYAETLEVLTNMLEMNEFDNKDKTEIKNLSMKIVKIMEVSLPSVSSIKKKASGS